MRWQGFTFEVETRSLSNQTNKSVPAASDTASSDDVPGVIGAVKAISAGLAASVTIEAGASRLLDGLGWSEIIVPIAVAIGLLVVSSYQVFANSTEPSSLAGGRPVVRRRYDSNRRLLGKVGIAAASVLLALRLWDIHPNFIAGKSSVSGFICTDDTGDPITHGLIEVLSRSGTVISTTEPLDDRGYFYADVKKLALRPAALRLRGCNAVRELSLADASQEICTSARDVPAIKKPSLAEWAISCDKP
jgi:hypothetical protein